MGLKSTAVFGAKVRDSFFKTIQIKPKRFCVGFQKLILEPQKKRIQIGFGIKFYLLTAMLGPIARK